MLSMHGECREDCTDVVNDSQSEEEQSYDTMRAIRSSVRTEMAVGMALSLCQLCRYSWMYEVGYESDGTSSWVESCIVTYSTLVRARLNTRFVRIFLTIIIKIMSESSSIHVRHFIQDTNYRTQELTTSRFSSIGVNLCSCGDL